MHTSLDGASWVSLPARPWVLVPVGSTEQHGPHLPLGTDALIAESVARAAAPRVAAATGRSVTVAPVLSYGASGEHQDFPGTISIGHDALQVVLIEIVRSISCWADRVVFVSGHGGNLPSLRLVVDQMRREHHDVWCVACGHESPTNAHAGFDETSLLLHLRPDLVDVERITPGTTESLASLMPRLVAGGVKAVSANGVLGDPTAANSNAGSVLFGEFVDRAVWEITREH